MQQPITLSAQYSQSTKKKQAWGALRGVALLFKVLAWIAATSGCIVAVVGIVVGATTHPTAVKSGTLAIGLGSSPMLGGILFAVLCLLVTGLACLFLFALSELIMLLIAIEQNTRTHI